MTTYTQSQGIPYGQQQMQAPPMYAQPVQPTIMVTQPQSPMFVGGCPTCQAGVLTDEFTVCGLIWAICCFPIGLLCCFMLREKRCSNCGSTFG